MKILKSQLSALKVSTTGAILSRSFSIACCRFQKTQTKLSSKYDSQAKLNGLFAVNPLSKSKNTHIISRNKYTGEEEVKWDSLADVMRKHNNKGNYVETIHMAVRIDALKLDPPAEIISLIMIALLNQKFSLVSPVILRILERGIENSHQLPKDLSFGVIKHLLYKVSVTYIDNFTRTSLFNILLNKYFVSNEHTEFKIVLFNAMIDSCIKSGQTEQAVDFFYQAVLYHNFPVSKINYQNLILGILRKDKDVEGAFELTKFVRQEIEEENNDKGKSSLLKKTSIDPFLLTHLFESAVETNNTEFIEYIWEQFIILQDINPSDYELFKILHNNNYNKLGGVVADVFRKLSLTETAQKLSGMDVASILSSFTSSPKFISYVKKLKKANTEPSFELNKPSLEALSLRKEEDNEILNIKPLIEKKENKSASPEIVILYSLVQFCWRFFPEMSYKLLDPAFLNVWRIHDNPKTFLTEFMYMPLDEDTPYAFAFIDKEDTKMVESFKTFFMNCLIRSIERCWGPSGALNAYRLMTTEGYKPDIATFEELAVSGFILKHCKKLGYLIHNECTQTYNITPSKRMYDLLLRGAMKGSDYSSVLYYIAHLDKLSKESPSEHPPPLIFLGKRLVKYLSDCFASIDDRRFENLILRRKGIDEKEYQSYLTFPSEAALRASGKGKVAFSNSYNFTKDMDYSHYFVNGWPLDALPKKKKELL